MGCGRVRLSTAPEIDITLELTYISRFDVVVRQLEEPFDVLIASLKVIRNDLNEICRTFCLDETIKSPTFADVLFAAVLCVAAECGGDFQLCKLQMSAKAPHLSVDLTTLSPVNAERFHNLLKFIDSAEAIPTKLRTIESTVNTALTRAISTFYSDITDSYKTEVENANLGALEMDQIRVKCKANIEKIKASLVLISECISTVSRIQKDLKSSSTLPSRFSSLWSEVHPSDLPTLIRTHWPSASRLL